MLMPLNDFHAWEMMAKAGDRVTYFEGHLAYDRGGEKKTPYQTEICMTADRAFAAQEAGRVHLIQERSGDLRWKYIAVKAHAVGRTAGASQRIAA